ncbi:hypothetical protein SAMN05421812_110279 [Asanoa hainanensis]|uniref:Peptidase MA superfamily protein n=1 Tax=Asanoa hainanensis TaxID=560556 RepID=A0A239NTR1_9ACTN|nr:hypothetical protein [Asanoa hainanensis]SNT58247.1 hypothetical protein SAMN05421812_110279 [Asanoa hainanensis]
MAYGDIDPTNAGDPANVPPAEQPPLTTPPADAAVPGEPPLAVPPPLPPFTLPPLAAPPAAVTPFAAPPIAEPPPAPTEPVPAAPATDVPAPDMSDTPAADAPAAPAVDLPAVETPEMRPVTEDVAPIDVVPAPKRKRGLLVGLVVTLVLVLLAVPAFLVLGSGGGDEPATAAAPSPSATPAASPTGPPASPKPGDPPYVAFGWAKASIYQSLTDMSTAYEANNLAGFLKPVADKKLRAELERRFKSLRAMKVTNLQLTADSGPFDDKKVGGWSEWGVTVAINHCFVVATCEPDRMLVDTAWRDSPSGYRLVKWSGVKDLRGPQPWEVSNLTAAVGSRAIVAAPKALASRARSFLPAAERAAKIADKYVLGRKPDRYVIYLAGPSDWKKWFGGSEDWAIGFAIPASEERSDIVLRAEEISGGYAESVMKHEMGHVATLAGRDYRDYNGENWWLTEGIAEYIEWDGRSVGSYDRKLSSRKFLREKSYKGDLEKLVPDDDAPDWQIDAAYGLAYYATRCVADQYGHKKLMKFADQVLRNGRPSEAESPVILGADWKTVSKRCLAYTKQKVGA